MCACQPQIFLGRPLQLSAIAETSIWILPVIEVSFYLSEFCDVIHTAVLCIPELHLHQESKCLHSLCFGLQKGVIR